MCFYLDFTGKKDDIWIPIWPTPQSPSQFVLNLGGKERCTGMPCFITLPLLCFVNICIYFFYKLNVCGNPTMSKPVGVIFPTACAHLTSQCHILVILATFQTFLLSLYLLSVIFDVTIEIVLTHHQLCPHKVHRT